MQSRRREFIDRTLPGMFRNMRLLDIGMDEVVERWNEENGDKGR